MKIYTTMRSERGKEVSKGGNEYVDIDIFCGSTDNSVTLARLTIRPSEHDGYILVDQNDTILAELTKEELIAPKRQR